MTGGTGSRLLTVTTALAVGLAGGWWLARGNDRVHRRALFARSRWRRFAALGWLERHGDAAALPVLRDYLAWEREPALRHRARRVLGALEVAA